jgi:hypothetical protein
MSLLGRIFDFIKGLFTRPGLNDFLHKYQAKAIDVIENLAKAHDSQGLDLWWDDAFAQFKGLVQADIKNVHDNWLTIALSLAYEIYKAEKEGHQA